MLEGSMQRTRGRVGLCQIGVPEAAPVGGDEFHIPIKARCSSWTRGTSSIVYRSSLVDGHRTFPRISASSKMNCPK